MQMPTKLLIVTVVGLHALLIAALAVILAPPPQVAYAQNPQPTVQIELNHAFGKATPGQPLARYTFRNFQSITCDANDGNEHSVDFPDPCYHLTEIYYRDTNNRASECEQGLGGPRSFSKGEGISHVEDFNTLSSSCPTGRQYILKAILMGSNKVEVASAIEYFGVNVEPDPTPIVTSTPTRTPTPTRQQGGGNQGNGGNQGGNNPTVTPTATPTIVPNVPTATPTSTPTIVPNVPTVTPTATPTIDPNVPTATPTATPTIDPQYPLPPPQDDYDPTATPTATTTPTEEGNGGNGDNPTATPTTTPTVEGNGGNQGNNQGRQPGGNNQNNNQGRSDNQGSGGNGGNQGGSKQGGGVIVQSFISYPTPLPQSSQPQSQTPLAITIPEIMNVRTGPGLTYDIVTTVPAGTQGTIVGTDPDNDWYQVEIVGVEGQVWIYQDLTTLVGSLVGVKQYTALEITQLTTGTPTGDGTAPLAITIPELMNVRTGPGLTYNIVTTVPVGTQGYIYGIDPNDDWFHIELEGFETRVWVYQDLTTVIGSLAGVKLYTLQEIAQLLGTPGADGSVPLAITVPITMNVRTGPGLLYDIVGVVPQGTQGRIFGIDPNNDWFQIELEGLDTLVWVYQDLTTVIGSLAGVKWVTLEELALLPAAITQPALLNARAGPGLTYDILTTIPQGTWTKITGIDTLGEWYRVELDDLDQQVWIFRDYTKVAGGSLSGLIQLALGGTPPPAVSQLTSSITVDLSLPPVGGVDMEVSWVDRNTCAQLYSLYHRASTDTTTYISLDQAATASSVNSKSLSFSTLSGNSYISAWCGTMAGGREVAEVEIDPGVAGTYSSTSTSGGLATVPDATDGSR